MLMIKKKSEKEQVNTKTVFMPKFDIPFLKSLMKEISLVRKGICNIYRSTLYMTVWIHVCLAFMISRR